MEKNNDNVVKDEEVVDVKSNAPLDPRTEILNVLEFLQTKLKNVNEIIVDGENKISSLRAERLKTEGAYQTFAELAIKLGYVKVDRE